MSNNDLPCDICGGMHHPVECQLEVHLSREELERNIVFVDGSMEAKLQALRAELAERDKHIAELEGRISSVKGVLLEAELLCSRITNSLPETTVKGDIEFLALLCEMHIREALTPGKGTP